jgi:hypothetical protein
MARPLRVSLVGALLAPTLLWLGGGCAHRRPSAARQPAPSQPAEVVLSVTNHHFLDITIYVEHDGLRTRVGTVTAASRQEFTLPIRLFGMSRQFTLLAEAIGSAEYVRTETLLVQPGQLIEWTLEHDLRRSSVGVF